MYCRGSNAFESPRYYSTRRSEEDDELREGQTQRKSGQSKEHLRSSHKHVRRSWLGEGMSAVEKEGLC